MAYYYTTFSPLDSDTLETAEVTNAKNTIDGQEISEGDVISDNGTKLTVSKIKSVDITTLPGWASLSTGSHNITIVAKAAGYIDSEKSAGVEVIK